MTDKETSDSSKFFVSRRGRQVGVHQVDLDGIDIEKDTPQASAEPIKTKRTRVVEKKEPSTPKNPKRFGKGWTRKKVIITAVVLALVILPLVFAEFVTAQYRSGINGARADLTQTVSSTVLPAQKKTSITADQIQGIANQVNEIVGKMCRGGLIDNAAGLYPRAQSALEDCKTSQSKYAALANNLYQLESQARYLERVDAIIKPVATPITDAFAVIGAQQAAWQTAAEGIKKLSPPEVMKAAHNELSTHVSAVATGWSQLNTVNNSQDGSAFQTAEKVLSAEYEAVRKSNAGFTAILAGTQLLITTNYNALK